MSKLVNCHSPVEHSIDLIGFLDFFQRTEEVKERQLEPVIDTSAFVVGLLGAAVLHQSMHASAQRRDEVGSLGTALAWHRTSIGLGYMNLVRQ